MAGRPGDVSETLARPKTLLQVCNVGRIVGGTAACAWTVTRALSEFRHHVLFLSPPDRETIDAFAPVPVTSAAMIDPLDLARFCPDHILLHNTPAVRIVGPLPCPSLLYLHSAISHPAQADAVVCCSHWLARRMGRAETSVLWQAVPGITTLRVAADLRDSPLVIGRLCTPELRKWPRAVAPFYAELAAKFPAAQWEFVGCPGGLRPDLNSACRGRAVFHSAGWRQRELLARWDVLLYSNPSLPESFGRTAAEAMRSGCIPVVDRLGGFVEQIPIDCGFLCATRSEFAAALARLTDDALRRQMSDRARLHANERFSLPRFAANLLCWLDRAGQEQRVRRVEG